MDIEQKYIDKAIEISEKIFKKIEKVPVKQKINYLVVSYQVEIAILIKMNDLLRDDNIGEIE